MVFSSIKLSFTVEEGGFLIPFKTLSNIFNLPEREFSEGKT